MMHPYAAALMTKEEAAREAARQSAIETSGAKFIEIKQTDPKIKRIGTVEKVVAQFADEDGVGTYVPKYVSGDETFMNARRIITLLDTPYNRRFLVSHYGLHWQILDPVVDAEIRAEHEKLAKQAPITGNARVARPVALRDPMQMADDELDAQLRELEIEKQRRSLANQPIPVRPRRRRTRKGEPAAPVQEPVGTETEPEDDLMIPSGEEADPDTAKEPPADTKTDPETET